MQTALEARNLVKRYPGVVAVNDVSFKVREGICFGLLGPNGAGKTTTVEIIEGVTPATAGEVFYFGELAVRPSFRSPRVLRTAAGLLQALGPGLDALLHDRGDRVRLDRRTSRLASELLDSPIRATLDDMETCTRAAGDWVPTPSRLIWPRPRLLRS